MGGLAGLLAAAAALSVAELIAGTSRRLRSPVLDVGDRVVDHVPASVKQLAIDWFGTRDKLALLVGIGAILTVYAMIVGIVAARIHRWGGAIGIAMFGAVGVWATVASRVDRPWWAVLPSVVGAMVAAGVLLGLLRLDGRTRADIGRPRRAPQIAEPEPSGDGHGLGAEDEPAGPGGIDHGHDRRRFLVGAGAVAASAAAMAATGRWLGSRLGAAASRAATVLPRPIIPAPPTPPDAALAVDGISALYTPNDRFYRIDTALTVPQVPAESWRLRIGGMVDRRLELGFDELLQRDLVEADITLTCVSNEIGGGLVGNARWLGVRLDDLLAEAGIDPAADQVVGRSVDGYTCGFPVAALDGRTALVAVGMNGEPLPLAHGFPARLVVPGLYGYVSATKWLTEIELTTFAAFDQYWVPRGWDADAPILTMSRIDTPRGLATVDAGTVPIAGVAWAQTRGIRSVEVRIDEGAWQEASLADEISIETWRQWQFRWDATPGRHTIAVRAIDGAGAVQTDVRATPMPNGATGHHSIVVQVRG